MPLDDDARASYTFSIEIDGIRIAHFHEVSGLSVEVTTVPHRESDPGGLPVWKAFPDATKHGDITLKRRYTYSHELWRWIRTVQDGDMDEARKNGAIVLHDRASTEMSRFDFVNAWPRRVSIVSIEIDGSEVLIEECVLVHEGIAPA